MTQPATGAIAYQAEEDKCKCKPTLQLTYSIMKGLFLSYHACMVWEVNDPLSREKCRLRVSPSHIIHHITTMIYLEYWCYPTTMKLHTSLDH